MDSDATPQQALAEVERATAALWAHNPPTPWWYCPGSGAWHAGFVLAVGGLQGSPALLAMAMVGLFAVLVRFTTWYTRYRGTIPRVGSSMPAEFRPATVGFAVYERAYAAAAAATRERLG